MHLFLTPSEATLVNTVQILGIEPKPKIEFLLGIGGIHNFSFGPYLRPKAAISDSTMHMITPIQIERLEFRQIKEDVAC